MTLDDRLMNWGRWARVGIKLGQCGSAEGNYRSNWRQWVELKDINLSEEIDAFDAEEVEAAWRTLPNRERKVLKFHYIKRMPLVMIAQRCGIKLHQYDVTFARAHYHIRTSLANQNNLCYAGHKSDTASVKDEREMASDEAVCA